MSDRGSDYAWILEEALKSISKNADFMAQVSVSMGRVDERVQMLQREIQGLQLAVKGEGDRGGMISKMMEMQGEIKDLQDWRSVEIQRRGKMADYGVQMVLSLIGGGAGVGALVWEFFRWKMSQ